MKKIVSCLLAAMLVISGWCTALPAGAVNRGSMAAAGEMEHTLSVEGSNSFGNLLEQTLNDKLEEQEENNGCNIFSAEVIDTTVVVDFETVENCTLVVGIYDESGEQMLASGSAETIKGERTAYVEIETDQMPEYFYLRAFLADTEDFRPLCTVYESPNYTQEMQEFLSKTTDDFQADRVLNLDDDKTNNFAVYDEDTKLITQHEDVNQIAAADEVNQVYVIENADSSVTSLQTGDIFAYEHGDNEVLIIKVSSIEMNGTTATIIGEETSLEDVFAYIKIDATADTADAQVDASSCEEGVIYEGLVDYEDEDAPQTYAVDIEEKGSVAISVNLAEKKISSGDNYAKISGGLKLTFEPSLKLYLSFTYQYLELKISYSANINASISGQVKGKISMPAIGFSPIPGVLIEFTPSFIARANASVSLSGTLGGTIGFAVSSEEGTKNLTAAPQFKTKLKGEVTVFIGFSLEPKVVIISDKIAEAGLSVEAGAEIKAVMAPNKTASSPSVHSCKACIDGDISAKYSASFKAKLLGWDRLTFIYNMREKTIKLWDFYYSFDYNDFGFTTCPHWMHKMTVIVKDMDGNPISDAEVGNNYITDDKGTVSFYLPNGSYTILVSKRGYEATTATVNVENPQKAVVILKDITSDAIEFNGHYYKLFDNSLSWSEAKTFCESLNGYLATVTSTDEMNFIKELLDNSSKNCYWIGLKRESVSSPWEWITGEKYNYTNWAANEPNNDHMKEELYVHMFGKTYTGGKGIKYAGQWNDAADNGADYASSFYHIDNFGFVCEWGDVTEISETVEPVQMNNAVITREKSEKITETIEFTELYPSQIYNFYVMNSRVAPDKFSSNNLLYVGQYVSDENGNLTVSYIPKENDSFAEKFVVGMTRTDLSSAEITLSNLIYNGQEQFVDPRVSYNGIVLTEGEDYEVCGDYSVTEIGEYTVIINGIGSYTGTRKITFCVDYPTPTVTLSASTTTPAEGESVTLTAQMDGNGSYRYKFTLVDLATNRTSVLRNFGTSNKLIWKAAGAGTEKKICVEVKDDDGNIYKDSVQITVGM